jgi:hypothetical protein
MGVRGEDSDTLQGCFYPKINLERVRYNWDLLRVQGFCGMV